MNTSTHLTHSAWRERLNPLRGLTMQRLATMLEQAEYGAHADIQWLYRMIEKRDPILRAGLRRRLAALEKMEWQIQTEDSSSLATDQADALRAAYGEIENLKEAISFLATAEFRGFAHLEKQYGTGRSSRSHTCTRLEPVPQWHWVRPGLRAPWQYNAHATSGINSATPIDPNNFIIREVPDPIDEIAAISFLRRNLSQKDWDAFIETYGIPPLFAEMPPNLPADKEKEYQALAEAVITDARGALPHGARIQTVEPGARGQNPFREHIEYQDQLVVLAITGGKLTMLNEATGIGGSQALVHMQVFEELAQAEAARISELFQIQFDLPLLEDDFSGQPVKAWFRLSLPPQRDASRAIDDISKLRNAGYRIEDNEILALTGYRVSTQPTLP